MSSRLRGSNSPIVIALAGALAILFSATCGNSNSPSKIIVGLSGTWTGIVGQPMSGTALRLAWTATQANTVVSGPATLVKPGPGVVATGAMNGVLSSNGRMTLTYVVAAGTVPGYPACSIIGAGNTDVTDSTISGDLTLNFTSCSGSGLEPTGSTQLSLTR